MYELDGTTLSRTRIAENATSGSWVDRYCRLHLVDYSVVVLFSKAEFTST